MELVTKQSRHASYYDIYLAEGEKAVMDELRCKGFSEYVCNKIIKHIKNLVTEDSKSVYNHGNMKDRGKIDDGNYKDRRRN
jgi:hypothetical protein